MLSLLSLEIRLSIPMKLRGIKITDSSGNERLASVAYEAKLRRGSEYVYTACMFLQ